MPASGTGDDPVPAGSITGLLAEFGSGSRQLEDRLLPLVYSQLRKVAAGHLRRERPNHTLQPTALVNEAWMRLDPQPEAGWQNRVHFFAVASRLMRQILVDYARRRRSEKRGGALRQITLNEDWGGAGPDPTDVLALDEALNRLHQVAPRAARIVELHFFGGLSFEEMELVLGVSTRTLKRDWSMARAWLRSELS
jgi:RNA polymerase sigma-70 factor, ECF subfamily